MRPSVRSVRQSSRRSSPADGTPSVLVFQLRLGVPKRPKQKPRYSAGVDLNFNIVSYNIILPPKSPIGRQRFGKFRSPFPIVWRFPKVNRFSSCERFVPRYGDQWRSADPIYPARSTWLLIDAVSSGHPAFGNVPVEL